MTSTVTRPYLYTDSTGELVTGMQYVLGWHWANDQASGKDIAADDDFLLSDANGIRLSGKRAIVAGDDLLVILPKAIPVNGLTVTAMDGGVLYVYIS